MNFCPNCGARIPNPDEDQFCMNCGYKLSAHEGGAPAESTPAAEAPPPTQAAPAAEAPVQAPGGAAAAPVQASDIKPPAAPQQAPTAGAGVAAQKTAEFVLPPQFKPVTPQAPPPAAPQEALLPPVAEDADDLLSLIDEVQADTTQRPAQGQPAVRAAATSVQRPAQPAQQQPAAPRLQAQPAAPKAPVQQTAPETPTPAATAPASPPQQATPPTAPQAAAPAQPAQRVIAPTPVQQAPMAEAPRPRLPDEPAPAAPQAQKGALQHTQPSIFDAPAPVQRVSATPLGGNLFEEAAAPTVRRTPAPPPVTLPDDERPRRSPVKTVLTVVIVFLIFVVAVAATTLIMLYFSNRPAKTIDALATAISEYDYDTLNDIVALRGIAPSKEGWDAFCDTFQQSAATNRLRSQLLKQADGDAADTLAYPAVGIEGNEFFLFFKKYYITVEAVQLLAPAAQDGTTVQLNGAAYNGTANAEGVLYSGLMPGHYECLVVPPGADAASLEAVEIEIFETAAPNVLEVAEALTATLTITNCMNDEADILVNNIPSGEYPFEGEVILDGIALGSTITIIATDAEGVKWEASVTFDNIYSTDLSFENYTQQGGASTGDDDSTPDSGALATAEDLSKAEIDDILTTFYASYLQCINDQKMDAIELSTAKNNAALATRITATANAANTFEFASATSDAASITAKELNGVPMVECNGTFGYKYKPRDSADAMQAATNNQSVQLVYQNGEWLVNGFTFVSEGDFNNHIIASFE